MIRTAILTVCLVILGSCAHPVYQSASNLGFGDEPKQDGLAYYLPKSLITVTIAPVGYEKDTKVTTLSKSEAAFAEAVQNSAVWTDAIIDGKLTRVLVDKDGELVRRLITGVTIENITSESVADTEHPLILRYKSNAFFTDKICASATDQGLLTRVQAATKDETGNVILQIAKLFGRIAGPDVFTALDETDIAKLRFSRTIDPFNEQDYRDLITAIENRFPELRGRYEFEMAEDPAFTRLPPLLECPSGAVCYRTKVPVRFGLTDTRRGRNGAQYTQKFTVDVINPRRTGYIDISRAFLIEKLTKLTFTDGVLDQIQIDKPSEALATAKLPLTVYNAVLTAVLSAPGRFVEDFVPVAGTEKAITLLQQEQANLELIKKLATDEEDGLQVSEDRDDVSERGIGSQTFCNDEDKLRDSIL